MRNSIVTADLHLTSSPRDAYRFGLFPWLEKVQDKTDAETLFILGDLTDAKDYHSSLLVNKVVDGVASVAQRYKNTYIVKGNHDGVDPDTPYFRFLSAVPGVRFIVDPTEVWIPPQPVLLLPHTRTPEEDWKGLPFDKFGTILAHFTAAGSESESGFTLDGVTWDALSKTKTPIVSGDVHVPQEIGCEGTTWLTYVGTPYPVRFLEGEQKPFRVLHFDKRGARNDLHFPCLGRKTYAVENPDQLRKKKLVAGDQVKVRVVLSRADFGLWFGFRKEIQEVCEQARVELVSTELIKKEEVRTDRPKIKKASTLKPEEMFRRYCKAKKVEEALVEAGEKLLKEGA